MDPWLLLLLDLLFALVDFGLVRSSDPLLSPKGVNYEVVALMSMKSKIRDETGVMDGWDINSVDPCTWLMVGCLSDGFVISLEMASNGLSGTLSPSVGNLSHLRTMLLQHNRISSLLPSEIGKLSLLQTLDLSGNQFIGEIPSSLGLLTPQLSYLRLNRNNFSGHIPKGVANLAGLTFLDLSFNNLAGPTPKILAKDYSVAGNLFLCNSSAIHGCAEVPLTVSETTTSGKTDGRQLAFAVFLSVGCTLMISFTLLVYWLHYYQGYDFEMGHLKRFSFRELQIATDNFSSKNILGQGGFGVVYKGHLRNGTVVAVKRLKDPNLTGEVQFQTEVEMIGLALHRNLLRLYGFCMTSNERLLVYPYMPNGSVADRLRDRHHEKPSLDWSKRMRIAFGAARGLLYLHEQCNPEIIHRDVEAANILLDETFEADKTDVFGFGILLLELITGPKILNSGNSTVQKGMILDWVRVLHDEKRLHALVDRDLNGLFNGNELESVVEVILSCTMSNPVLRPKMSEVVKALEAARPADPIEAANGEILCAGPGSFSRSYDDANEASSFIIEAIELSRPR